MGRTLGPRLVTFSRFDHLRYALVTLRYLRPVIPRSSSLRTILTSDAMRAATLSGVSTLYGTRRLGGYPRVVLGRRTFGRLSHFLMTVTQVRVHCPSHCPVNRLTLGVVSRSGNGLCRSVA